MYYNRGSYATAVQNAIWRWLWKHGWEDPDWGNRLPASYLSRFQLAALNPQPLPPKGGDRWDAVYKAQSIINGAFIDYMEAERAGGQIFERAREEIRGSIMSDVDDLCPPWFKWPFPWPPPPWWDLSNFRVDELELAAKQFEIAAGLDTPLQSEFADAAARLHDAAGQMG